VWVEVREEGVCEGGRDHGDDAKVEVDINMAAFSGTDRKKRARTDK